MKLIYIDEAGNTGTRVDDPDQPYHLLAAFIVDDNNVRIIENDMRLLGLKHFGGASQNTDFEFHGYDICNRKGRYFAGLKIEKRIEIMDDLLNIIKNHNLQIIYTIINKPASKAMLHPHQLAFLFLIERIEDYLAKENSLGLLIADENDDIEQRMIDDLERFKTIDTGFGYRPTKIDHIIDSIHFVKSNNNHLIQLADVIAHVLLRGKKTNVSLREAYKSYCLLTESPISFADWSNQQATLKQKTELRHLSLISSLPLVFKEFP